MPMSRPQAAGETLPGPQFLGRLLSQVSCLAGCWGPRTEATRGNWGPWKPGAPVSKAQQPRAKDARQT